MRSSSHPANVVVPVTSGRSGISAPDRTALPTAPGSANGTIRARLPVTERHCRARSLTSAVSGPATSIRPRSAGPPAASATATATSADATVRRGIRGRTRTPKRAMGENSPATSPWNCVARTRVQSTGPASTTRSCAAFAL